jgi:dihydropyrimidinase
MKKEIWSARPGFPGIETYLPLMLSEGVNKGRLTLQRLVQVACENNAKVLGIYPQKGVLEVGSDADVVILDLKKKKRILSSRLHHIADFCVHEGWEVKGWPNMEKAGILRGHC